MASAKEQLPRRITATIDGAPPSTFVFERLVSEGGGAAAAIYVSPNKKRVTVKAQYCGDPSAKDRGQREAALAKQAAAAIGNNDCFPEGCRDCRVKATAVRQPLSTVHKGNCTFALYSHAYPTLPEWLAHTPKRSSSVVMSLFQQALGLILCLKDKGYYYTDIKPSNFVVSDFDSKRGPQLVIGGLGGLVTENSEDVELPVERIPPVMLKDFNWKKMDQVTSFMLALLALELVLRTPLSTDPRSPLDSFLACIHKNATLASSPAPPNCLQELVSHLNNNLANGLSLKDPQVQSLVSAALNMLGYHRVYVKPAEIAGLLGQRRSSPVNR